jgi:hypothetical protein
LSLTQKSGKKGRFAKVSGCNPVRSACGSKRTKRGLTKIAHVAQLVERFLGKEEVHRFNPGRGLHYTFWGSVVYLNVIFF